MEKHNLQTTLTHFSKTLPHFPDGRINYSLSRVAPVVIIFVKHQEKILLLKRSNKVQTYKGKWNTVAGYLDEPVPLKIKVLEELREELGIKQPRIKSLMFGKSYSFKDTEINKTWLIHPVLVILKKAKQEVPKIKIDWEHTEYKWINSKDLKKFDTVPNLEKSLKCAHS